ncbi:MAG: hypothetical protein WBA45_17390 [Microthrixaceae bacterium]
MRSIRDHEARSTDRRFRRDSHLVTVLSPHFDDVALSLGQSLRDGRLSRHPVRVRVAFGKTNWTSWVHPTPERAGYVSVWRRLEESAASLAFGYRWTAASWPEVILRTGDMSPEQILDSSRDLATEPLVAEMARWISAVRRAPQGRGTRNRPPELILVAAGLGGHIDHRILSSAAETVARRSGAPIGFYEDRPYSAYLSEDDRDRHMASFGLDLRPVPVSLPVQMSTQVLARMCYPSQMSPYFREAMDLDRRVSAVEQIWFPGGVAPDWF